MTAISLSSSAEQCIEAMHLTPDNQEIIRNCIRSYIADPQTFCELINYIVFRIVEGIKSVFGMSDWQRALNLIKQRGVELMSTNPPPAIRNLLDVRIIRNNSFDDVADALMTFCLQAQTHEFSSLNTITAASDLENYVANRRFYQIA